MAIGRGIVAFALLGMAASRTATAQTYDELRGWCFQGAKSQEQVLQGCDAVIRSGRESVDDLAVAQVRRGIALRRLGHPDRALQAYGEAIRLKPSYSQAFNSRCYLYAITNRLQEALKDCNEALRLDPNSQYAYDSRAFAYLKLGMLDAAIADYNVALRLEPGRPYSLFGRGIARQRKGDKAGGGADMAAAKAKTPGIAEEFAQYGVRPN